VSALEEARYQRARYQVRPSVAIAPPLVGIAEIPVRDDDVPLANRITATGMKANPAPPAA